MSHDKAQEFYLKDGRLDLSILNENPGEDTVEVFNTILDDIEAIEVKNEDISSTLEEMAMIFEEEDGFEQAFNPARLEEEKKEFEKMD